MIIGQFVIADARGTPASGQDCLRHRQSDFEHPGTVQPALLQILQRAVSLGERIKLDAG